MGIFTVKFPTTHYRNVFWRTLKSCAQLSVSNPLAPRHGLPQAAPDWFTGNISEV
jgi:hypothetical protein